jgi:hypothetical protein
MIIPSDAIVRITFLGAALEPIAEFRKFTASLETPTYKPPMAKRMSTTTAKM